VKVLAPLAIVFVLAAPGLVVLAIAMWVARRERAQ